MRTTTSFLEAKRLLLRDAVFETALAPLRQQLAASETPAPPPAPSEDRRIITILFTDVVGSTTMGEQLDPEQITRPMNAAVRAFDATVVAVSFEQNGEARMLYTNGQWKDDAALRFPLQSDGVTLGELALSTRRSGSDYSERAQSALKGAVAAVVRALALMARMNGDRK